MRKAGWEGRLAQAIDARRRTPFGPWGVYDCVVFAGECVEALVGHNPAAQFAGQYEGAKSALVVLSKLGFASLEAWLDANFPAVAPASAQRGDLALLTDEAAEGLFGALGVFCGQSIAAPGEKGLHFLGRAAARKAYGVR